MRSVPMIKVAEMVVAVFVLVLVAGLATSCNDSGEADMYAQISSGGSPAGSLTQGGGSSTSVAGGNSTGGQMAGGSAGDDTPVGLPGQTPATGEEGADAETPAEGEADATLVPGVTILNVEVKIPYPEFTGADRYDVKVTLITEKPIEAQVFVIKAIGVDGEVVAEQKRDLRLPRKKPGTLHFDDWYCMSLPVTVEFHTTDTQATAADGSTDNVEGRPGGGGRGGSSSSGGGAELN